MTFHQCSSIGFKSKFVQNVRIEMDKNCMKFYESHLFLSDFMHEIAPKCMLAHFLKLLSTKPSAKSFELLYKNELKHLRASEI